MIWEKYGDRWLMITRRLADNLFRTTGVCPNCGGVVRQYEAPTSAVEELREYMPADCPFCGWEEPHETSR